MNTYSNGQRHPSLRTLTAGSAMIMLLAGCNPPTGQGFDWDLRSAAAGNTAEAARNATAARPTADQRGVISYPGYQVVVTRPHETVAQVAQRLGLNVNELAATNAIQPDIVLLGGEILVLPRRVTEPAVAATSAPLAPAQSADVGTIATTALDRVAPAQTTSNGTTVGRTIGSSTQTASGTSITPAARPAATTTAAATSSGKEPIRHKVQRGETAYVIARRYDVPARALAEWNGLDANMNLREGQTLLIPPSADAPAPARAATTAAVTAPGQGSATPTPPSASRPLPAETPVRAGGGTVAAPASPTLPTTTASTGGRLAMPADGSVIRAYQKGKYDGVGIGAPAGSTVRAAADGTVAAITRDTEQVPIVVLRHADNLLTVYANADNLTIAKGDTVKRGQSIGKVRAGNPAFLHFEVRRGAESIDPMSMLK